MTALADSRKGSQLGGEGGPFTALRWPMKGGVVIYQGGLVYLGSDGYARPAAVAAGGRALGRADVNPQSNSSRKWDSTGLADGVKFVRVVPGIFQFNVGTVADVIAATDCGKDCWLIDDQTVGLADGTAGQKTRTFAGKIIALAYGSIGQVSDPTAVYVLVAPWVEPDARAAENKQQLITIPVMLKQLADATVVARWTADFPGRIIKAGVMVVDPATTGAKLSTLIAKIGATAITGFSIALTSANMTPAGNVVDSTAITALNKFAAGDVLTFLGSATTTFVEGMGLLQLKLG